MEITAHNTQRQLPLRISISLAENLDKPKAATQAYVQAFLHINIVDRTYTALTPTTTYLRHLTHRQLKQKAIFIRLKNCFASYAGICNSVDKLPHRKSQATPAH